MPLTKEADAARQRRKRSEARQSAQKRRTADLQAALGESVCDWIERVCVVPYGPRQGELFELLPYQRDYVAALTSGQYKACVQSTARKSGKTALVAVIALAGLFGPLNRPHWRAIVGSVTLQHAAELRMAIVETAKASGIDGLQELKSPAPGHLIGERSARIDFVSASNASGHALSADLAILDEAGLLEERKRELWNNFFAALSARGGTFAAISVMGFSPMLKELYDASHESDDIYFQLFKADDNPDITDREQWHKANPSLGIVKDLEFMEFEAQRIQAAPHNLNQFLAYHLNLPADPSRNPVCTPEDWKACTSVRLPRRKGHVILALDLGGATSMTAACAYWPDTLRAETWACFPGIPSLYERGRADSCGEAYQHMERRKELYTQEGVKSVDYKLFLADCLIRLDGQMPVCLVVDRYRLADLQTAMLQLGVNIPIVERGMGWKDGSEDVNAFLSYLHGGKIRHQESLLVSHAIGGSHIVEDPMLNKKCDKLRSTSRIDAIMCLILACGQAQRMQQHKPKKRRRRHALI